MAGAISAHVSTDVAIGSDTGSRGRLAIGLHLGGLGVAGQYLITQDVLVSADMVLVLSGQPFATDSSQTVLEYATLMDGWLRGLWHTVMGRPKEAPPLITVR
jgi:hypothetical protein